MKKKFLCLFILFTLTLGYFPLYADAAKVLFEDGFEEGTENWEYVRNIFPESSFSLVKEGKNTVGKLETTGTKASGREIVVGSSEVFDDAILEMDIKIGDENCEYFCLMFRQDGMNNYYALRWFLVESMMTVVKNGWFTPMKGAENRWSGDFGFNRNGWNKIKIVTIGNKCDIFINNGAKPAFSFTDTETPNLSGKIAFGIKTGQPENSVVYVDNVKVTAIASEGTDEIGGVAVADDVKDTDYEKQVALLTNLRIMNYDDNDKFNAGAPMTRLDFAKAMAKLYNIDIEAFNESGDVYSDIPKKHEAADLLSALKKMGIMNGYEDGSFGPDDPILYDETIKSLVSLLGYGEMARVKGGYPLGYFIVANEINLANGTSLLNKFAVTKKDMSKLIYNALNAPLCKAAGYSNDVIYETSRDTTLLTEVFGIHRVQGIVTATEFDNIVGGDNAPKGRVKIDGQMFLQEKTNCRELLGYRVEAYYKDDGENTLILVLPDEYKNIRVNSENIKSYSGKKYTYVENDKEKTIRLALNTNIIYNCKVIKTDPTPYYLPETGNITAIDNDGDGIYDTLVIKNYKTVFVEAVDKDKKVIYDKYKAENNIEFNLADKTVNSVITDGTNKEIGFAKIAVGNVLLAAQSLDGTMLDIIKSSKKAYGKINSIDITEKKVEIDNVLYKISPCYLNYKEELKIDTVQEVNLDAFEQVVEMMKQQDDSTRYGYLIKSNQMQEINNTTEIKFFSPDQNSIITLEVADRFNKLDGTTRDANKRLNDRLKEFSEKGTLFQYRLNTEGKISELDFPYVKNNPEQDESMDSIHSVCGESQYLYYKREAGVFGSNFALKNNTIIINIPTDLTQDKIFRVVTTDAFKDESMYVVEGYNSKANTYSCDVVLNYTNGKIPWYDAMPMIFDYVSYELGEDGEQQKAIHGFDMYGSKVRKVAVLIDENSQKVLNGLSKGDMVRYVLNTDGQVSELYSIYDVKTNIATEKDADKLTAQWRIMKRNIMFRGENYIGVVENEPSTSLVPEIISTVTPKIYIVDGDNDNTITVGNINDLKGYDKYGKEYSKVILHTERGVPRLIVIYK